MRMGWDTERSSRVKRSGREERRVEGRGWTPVNLLSSSPARNWVIIMDVKDKPGFTHKKKRSVQHAVGRWINGTRIATS